MVEAVARGASGRARRRRPEPQRRRPASARSSCRRAASPSTAYDRGRAFPNPRTVPAELRAEQQLRLLRSHASGGGPALPRERRPSGDGGASEPARRGGGASRPGCWTRSSRRSTRDFVPVGARAGSLGTADLTILAEIARRARSTVTTIRARRRATESEFMSSQCRGDRSRGAGGVRSATRLARRRAGGRRPVLPRRRSRPGSCCDARVHEARPASGRGWRSRPGCATAARPRARARAARVRARLVQDPVSVPRAPTGRGPRAGRARLPRARARRRVERGRRERPHRSRCARRPAERELPCWSSGARSRRLEGRPSRSPPRSARPA